jgi:hypothetical protein
MAFAHKSMQRDVVEVACNLKNHRSLEGSMSSVLARITSLAQTKKFNVLASYTTNPPVCELERQLNEGLLGKPPQPHPLPFNWFVPPGHEPFQLSEDEHVQ